LDKDLAEAYYYRGLILIDRDEGQKAVNEIVLARNLDRNSFDYCLALGRALLSANRLADARNQITAAGRLSDGDEDMAQVYYYRALTLEAIGNQPSANLDWEELLKLPPDAVPPAWRRISKARLATPTPTPTETLTPTPKSRE
jgi:tetratricopeptide (TPR) repeat protein